MYDPKILQIIRGPRNALSISIATDDEDHDNPVDTYPMLLFVPDQTKLKHYHIELNSMQTVALRDWLNEYLK